MDEFSLINRFFKQPQRHRPQHVDLGIGDDAALFRVADGHQCVVSSDLLIEHRHFSPNVPPETLGHKCLAVNLSDLAAMGAQPLGFTLSVGLPRIDEAWLDGFSKGLLALADIHQCPLIGGDTTRSELIVINITVLGQVPIGKAIRRDGAQIDDDIWVTGTLGDAAYALDLIQKTACDRAQLAHLDKVIERLHMPKPRLGIAQALRGIATSMLDISDGMAGDLPHLLRASQISARLSCDDLPLSAVLRDLPLEQAWHYAVAGGDDYELCFTAPSAARTLIENLARKYATPTTRVGTITPMSDTVRILWHSENAPQVAHTLAHVDGFNHFAPSAALSS